MAELKIEKEPWTFETVDLSKVIEFSCSTVEPLAKEHQILIQVQSVPNPVMAFGAGDKLNQLFDNLLINAVKYNRQGGRIEINLLENDQSAFVRISDTGVGISHDSLKEVFTRHFQERAKPLGNVKGLGIGLSLAQEIVHRHRGEIYVESKVGKGSTFTVRLPKLPPQSPGKML
jgi:signal transduction histidine kinase